MQAEDNLAKARAILDLYEDMKMRVAELTRSHYAVHALDWMFERPIFSTKSFLAEAGIPEHTARRFLKVLRKNGVLEVIRIGQGRRTAIFSFPALLNIAEGSDEFC